MKKRPESKGIEEILAGRIHDARARRGLTLAQLSKQTGISVAMLSKIENAKVSSPISVYAKIAKTLEIRLGELFSEDETASISFVKKEERKQYTRFAGYIGESIAFKKSKKKMEPFVLTYPPRKNLPPPYHHDNEEFIFVTEGELEFQYDGKIFILKPGDCVYFDANKKHSARAQNGKTAAKPPKPSWWMPKDRILSVG
jgi:mannose-6-phosphate isomerase-like protein (cupin superfamily)